MSEGKKKINWKSPTVIGVLLFLIIGFFFLAHEADAAETTFELGPSLFVAGDRYNGSYLAFDEEFNDKYAIGLGLTTPWTCTTDCKRGNGGTNQLIFS